MIKIRTKALYYLGTILGIFVVCPAFVALVHYNSNEVKDIELGRDFLLYFTPITSALVIGPYLLIGPVLSLECCDETVTLRCLARHRQVIAWEDISRIEIKSETFRTAKYHTTEHDLVLLLYFGEDGCIRMCFSEHQVNALNNFIEQAHRRGTVIQLPDRE